MAGYSGVTFADSRVAQTAPSIEFQSGFLRQSPEHASSAGQQALQALAQTHDLGPGRYLVDIRVNLIDFGQREIEFDLSPKGNHLAPCLSAELLGQMGVRLDSIADPDLLNDRCIDLQTLIPGADTDFDGSQLSLAISIPHIAMRRDVLGHIDPERWDPGINAAFVSYQASAQQGTNRYRGRQNTDDLYLNSGVNLGPWRLRSNQSLRQNENGQREWARAYSYAQRVLPGTHANLTLGETFTSGDVFKSQPITGVLIGSDMGILPDVLQGYAPVIRGVAQTRAKLEVFQNGYPLYTTYVSPGQYEIDDLSTNGGSGELEIVLTEADGQVRRFTQSFATVSNLLREGVWRYSAAMGRYNGSHGLEEPLLWQGTLAMGAGWNSTLYGGLMASEFYQAGTLGLARDLGHFGALSMDLTHSSADIGSLDSPHVQGMSYALKYGKAFATNTNLRFAGYRYSTEGYRDFDEAVRQRSQDAHWYGSRRSRLEASIYQSIGTRSNLSLTLSQQDYWQSGHTERQYQLNASTRYKSVGFNVFASQSLNTSRGSDRQIGLSISLPLDFGHSANASFDTQKSGDQFTQRATLSGSSDLNRLNYQASISRDDNRQHAAALSLGYQASFGGVGAGVTQGPDYRNVSLNATGALLLHADGIEAGPYLGETTALVEVPGIAGVGLMNAPGVQTNERGFALAPYLRPYRVNQLVLQTDQLGPDVEIDNGTAQVIPTRGAIVKNTFAARTVTRLVITGRTSRGQVLPFGAQLSNRQGDVLGVVGQAGQVMLSTSAEPQIIDVRWGELSEPQCQLHVDPQSMDLAQGYRMQELTCL
ncbi:fimbria/pilus outer membrane usher protein [Pseudomonas sp. C32]|uniref:fimbria/pilus outer membrane usher protein n=1 Tax=Pseudomonas sp. C32 TaxID=1529208 RepID=UPI0026277954|nr:fimbria/pilus outer membrane usher protein [Pseudomonas sp. C32]MDN4548021.1 fimbria/pilus outer membrane usher protein [Pseudomonas sp. C32]